MHRGQIPLVGNLWLIIKKNCIILMCKVFIPALAWDIILMSTHFFFFNFELKHKNLNTVDIVDLISYKANNHIVVTIC